MEKLNPEKLRQDLLEALPPVFGRSAVDRLLPGIIQSTTLANLSWAGEGPPTHKMGRRVIYSRDTFVDWLLGRS